MMSQLQKLPYVSDSRLGAEMIGLPYKGTGFGLFILLPTTPGLRGLQQIEAALTQSTFNDMIAAMSVQDVIVTLPRLRMNYKTDLRPILAGLGVCKLFTPNQVSALQEIYTVGTHCQAVHAPNNFLILLFPVISIVYDG